MKLGQHYNNVYVARLPSLWKVKEKLENQDTGHTNDPEIVHLNPPPPPLLCIPRTDSTQKHWLQPPLSQKSCSWPGTQMT